MPPTAGFIGKFGIFYAAIKAGYVYLAVIGIATAIISVYYYLRIVVTPYMRQDYEMESVPGQTLMPRLDTAGRAALAAVAAVIVYLGILPGSLLDLLSAIN